jgi:hypothetical protein
MTYFEAEWVGDKSTATVTGGGGGEVAGEVAEEGGHKNGG